VGMVLGNGPGSTHDMGAVGHELGARQGLQRALDFLHCTRDELHHTGYQLDDDDDDDELHNHRADHADQLDDDDDNLQRAAASCPVSIPGESPGLDRRPPEAIAEASSARDPVGPVDGPG
jgi:hypothetical protein